MTIKVYHQVGHCSNWNIDSFTKDLCGDGLIISPVHQTKQQVENLDDEVKQVSLFDPQFYLPNSNKNKLKSYPFFPEVVSNGFETVDFARYAETCAKKCIEFQIENDFEKLIIPARYYDQLEPKFTSRQEEYTIDAFLDVIERSGPDKEIFVTLPLTSHMITSKEFRVKVLNWITKFPEIDGIYLVVSDDRKTKQIQDSDYLYQLLELCSDLKSADFELIVGYLNTEGLLLSLIQDISITMGSFENTRMFSVDKFMSSDEVRRGPRPRIYLPRLFNWISFSQAKEIRNDLPSLWNKIYTPTDYSESVLNAVIEPAFNQPDLYKHSFEVYCAQVSELSALNSADCYRLLRKQLKDARRYYSEIDDEGIALELHGSGEHIQPWLDVIGKYYRGYLK